VKLIKGDKLPRAVKEEVLRSYVYRHLDTTCPTDDVWLAKHAFYVTNAGELSRAHHRCEPACLAEDT
jgi:hypothetical protein